MDCPKPSAEPISTHNHRDSAGSNSHRENRQHTMESFKQLVMKCIISSTPNKSLTPSQNFLVNQRLQELASRFHTSDHPPYSFMIRNAIEQLNEEGGSNKEAISQFIIEHHKDLPFAHNTLLEHHLRKLCESGELVETRDKHYLVREVNANLNRVSSPCPTLDLMLIANPSSSTSPIPSPSTSYRPSPSTSVNSSSSYSNDLEYMASSTSSSDVSYSPKRNRRKKKRGKPLKRNGKGLKVQSRCKKKQGQGQGRGRGGSRRRGQGREGRSRASRLNMKNTMEEEIEECGRGLGCGEPWLEKAMEENIVGHVDQMDNMMEELGKNMESDG